MIGGMCAKHIWCTRSIRWFPTLKLLIVLLKSFVTPSDAFLSGINYTLPGDINLGGIIPLHTYNEMTENCGALRSINSLKKLEAMVYAIREVNQNGLLLPNITLGFKIYDSCSYDARTLRESLNFIPSSDIPGDGCIAKSIPQEHLPIVGVVGAQRSASSVQAALLLGLYHIPQISYLSTSDELSDNSRFPYFLRVVGPDSYQVRAIVDILLHYDWKYVSFISSDDTYGRYGRQEFMSLASQHGICLGLLQSISLFDSTDHYDNLIDELLSIQQEYSASVVVLFVHLEMAQNVFAAATRQGSKAQRRFIWIGSDSWGNYGEEAVAGNEEAALGSFTIAHASNTLPDFNAYFRSITPNTSKDPWLLEFLQHYTNCTMEADDTNPDCNEPGLIEQLDTEESDPAHETLVMDSVFAFANALDTMRREFCPSGGLCSEMTSADGAVLRDYLLETRFVSLANGPVSFKQNGDVSGRYAIKYLQKHDSNTYTFDVIGTWDGETNSNSVIQEQVRWYLKERNSSRNVSEVPKSICSEPCRYGERINVDLDNPCCWTCTICYRHEIVAKNGTECQSCIDEDNQVFGWPNDNFTECVPLGTNENSWLYAIVATSVVGLVITIVVICLYTYNHENALIKASSRELSYIMFVGIFLAYLTSLVHGIYPSTGICVIRRLGQPIATSMIFVSLAVKTFRLFRIFRAGVKSAKRPKFISPNSQVSIALIISVIPLLWTVIWLIVDPPSVTRVMPYENEPHLQIACSRSPVANMGIHVWNLVVVLICSILAFLTRRLPENYNETKFITFCAFCSLIVFLAFSTTIVTVAEPYYRDLYVSLALVVNATMILFCLFIVKLYAIYFVKLEAWNVKKQTSELSQDVSVDASAKLPSAVVSLTNVRADLSGKGQMGDGNNTTHLMQEPVNGS